MWANFKQRRQMDETTPPFDKYLSNQLVEKVQKLDRVLINSKYQEIRVACTSFGYKNGEILRILEERGKFLGLGKFKEAQELDTKILENLE